MPGFKWHYMARLWRMPLLGEAVMLMMNKHTMRLSMSHGSARGIPASYVDEAYATFDWRTRRTVLKIFRSTMDIETPTQTAIAALSPWKIPALVVWGEGDVFTPARFAELQRRYFDVENIVYLPGSGHWPMLDNPEEVRSAVVPFMRTQLLNCADPGAGKSCSTSN